MTDPTDINGKVSLVVVGTVDQATYASNADFPEPDRPWPGPGSQNYFGCGTMWLLRPGFPPQQLHNVIVAALDHELITSGVGSSDLSRAVTDIASGNYRERSDYNTSVPAGGAGVLNSGDLSEMISFCFTSVTSCTPSAGGPCP